MDFFSAFKKKKRQGLDSTINSEGPIEINENPSMTQEIHTHLSISEKWILSDEQKYVLSFLSNELKPLKPNQLSLAGIDIEIEKATGNWLVKAFLRSSLSQNITLGKTELILTNKDGNFYAQKTFNLQALGSIPALSDRPSIFVFERNTQLRRMPPTAEWTLSFHLPTQETHQLDVDPSWEANVNENQKNHLRQLVSKLPSVKQNEVNFTGFQYQFKKDGSLTIGLFIRNGHVKEIIIDQLPLEVIDAKGQLVCKGTFKLPSLHVKANASKPWTFTFPKEKIRLTNVDFSHWIVQTQSSSQ